MKLKNIVMKSITCILSVATVLGAELVPVSKNHTETMDETMGCISFLEERTLQTAKMNVEKEESVIAMNNTVLTSGIERKKIQNTTEIIPLCIFDLEYAD